MMLLTFGDMHSIVSIVTNRLVWNALTTRLDLAGRSREYR